MKQLPNINKIWTVFIGYDDDNNMYVNAFDKKQAIGIARKYVEIEGDRVTNISAVHIIDDKEHLEWFLEDLTDDENKNKLLKGIIDGYCYDSGT